MASSQHTSEEAYWVQITVRNSRAAYREYLERFPAGKFVKQANRHLDWFERFDHRHLGGDNEKISWGWVILVLVVLGVGMAIGFFLS